MSEIVSVVACGPSALRCGAERAPGYVIAVNDAYRHVRHDAALSMDGRWALHRMPDFGGRDGTPLYIRRRSLSKFGDFNPVLWPRVRVYDCDHTTSLFGQSVDQLNGTNSGYVALNLAFVLRPRIVYLFGFDHKGAHFHPESEWVQRGEGSRNSGGKFRRWAGDCVEARRQFDDKGIKVINTNRDSAIRAFKFGDAP